MPSKAVLEKKQEVVNVLTEKIKNAKGIVFTDYRGLTVEQDTEMRRALRKAGVEYKVVKNTLLGLAIKQNGIEGFDKYLEGPTAIAMSDSDVVAPAKVISEYVKKYENLEIKVGLVEGKVMDVEGIKMLAALPPKEELVAKALGGLKSPIAGLVNVLNGNIRGLVVALNAIAEKKAAQPAAQ